MVYWAITHSLTPSISIERNSGLSTHHDPASGSSAHWCLPYQCPPLEYLPWFWLVALGSSFHGWVPTRLMRMLVALGAGDSDLLV